VAKDHEATWHEKQSGNPWDPRDVAIGDRVTMAFSSTTVTKGRALGVVVATGMKVRSLGWKFPGIELKQITD
jgi:Na+-exporting ATPase